MVLFRWRALILFLLVLLVALTGCEGLRVNANSVAGGSGPGAPTAPTTPGSAQTPRFAFWYSPWDPTITPAAIKPADVVIGIAPSIVPTVHALGKRALQYQTYYQSEPNSLLLNSTQDLTNVGFEINQQFVINIFGNPPNSYVLCPNSVVLHKRVQQYVQQSLSSGYDGLFLDNTFFDPPAHLVCDGSHAHVDPSAEGGRAYITLVSEVRQIIKAHNPEAILMTNPGNPLWLDRIATGSPTLWDVSDYVLWEGWGYTAATQHDQWNNYIPLSYQMVATHPDRVAQLVMLSYVKSVTEARFAFAAARFFGFTWTGNINNSFGNYLNSIPFGLGEPIGSLPPQAPVLQRMFEHGEVFVNTSATVQSVTVPAGNLYLGETNQALAVPTVVDLQPRVAAIVIF
ncbi:MAG TPA: hypothetical protein VKH81_04275 [Candidatus Angelobacter sp.]|nr:hypothetical protein [Candidatus Angelobacter sp.]